ncbi:hypothetical protein C9426_00935 [Serratia sp. S1B]|nr:hypothetical protein C9426_00935 [Serratia sp. S1B]
MSYLNTFFDGMVSAFDFAPSQNNHKPNFVKKVKPKTVNIQCYQDLNDSWVVIAECQKTAFKNITKKHSLNNIPKNYESECI